MVSTLLITVGDAYRPATAGKGGRSRGWPRRPSSESSSAVSSPQIYAPAPACTVSSRSETRAQDVAAQVPGVVRVLHGLL